MFFACVCLFFPDAHVSSHSPIICIFRRDVNLKTCSGHDTIINIAYQSDSSCRFLNGEGIEDDRCFLYLLLSTNSHTASPCNTAIFKEFICIQPETKLQIS